MPRRGNTTEPSDADDAVPSRKNTLSQTTISERVRYDFHDNPADMITIPRATKTEHDHQKRLTPPLASPSVHSYE
jgi:hypothetical protein